jgi:N-acetylglucosamine malate deacetylase 1
MRYIAKSLLKLMARMARPYLKSFGLLQTAKIFNRSSLVWNPGGERLVVLAPHMDDEVIGCGGTLARHVRCGADVTVVFLTDGRAGGKVSVETDIGVTRKIEARAALEALGIQSIVFLDAADGQLAATPALAQRLRTILSEKRPQIVYLPFFLEEHPDHRATSILLRDATRGSGLQFLCHGYEVWTPLFPNCLVRIDEVIEAKRQSLTHYQSQLAEADYLHSSLGLNAYRSNAFLGGTCRYAEAFCVLPLNLYIQLFESYGQGANK